MINVLIVDDDAISRHKIRELLGIYEAFHIVDECFNGENAIRLINKLKPDLVYLDMQLPDMTGLDVLEALPKDANPMVIFVTSFDQDALHICDVFSFDYLIKPLGRENFEASLINAANLLQMERENFTNQDNICATL